MGHFDDLQDDDAEFFRQATLRICGSLSVPTLLEESFAFLKDFIPMDRIALTRFYADRGEQLLLASADENGGREDHVVVPVHEAAQRAMSKGGDVTIRLDRAGDSPVSKAWIDRGELRPNESLISCRLRTRETVVGALIVTANEPGRFTDEHVRRLQLLREPFAIALSNALNHLELLAVRDGLEDDNRFLAAELSGAQGVQVVGANAGLRHVMERVHQVSRTRAPVLLTGETGVGKEVIAASIHRLSPRHDSPFIKVNCGALPESLLDSELFGHEKGAFTGAVQQRRGRFERANHGTIFLDEVGELPLSAQVRLLRVVQEQQLERVGGTRAVDLDVRIIAATHRDLEQMVASGDFREDLYFRLAVFPIVIPPLRERREDIVLLAQHFLRIKRRELGIENTSSLSASALAELRAYDWPGNVRELANVIERALIIDPGGPSSFDLSPSSRPASAPEPTPDGARRATLDEVMIEHITAVLEATDGQVGGKAGAAEWLAVNPSTLRKRMRKLGIPFGRDAR